MSVAERQLKDILTELRIQALAADTEEEMLVITRRINDTTRQLKIRHGIGLPLDPLSQAIEIDPRFRHRAHLDHLSQRVAQAVKDVENGHNRMLAVSMPPRMGKSTLLSLYSPLWILRRHPDWSIITASFDGTLTGEWARNVRNLIEDDPKLGISLARDGGAGSHWQTLEGGGIYSASIRSALTGRGARVLLIDDPIKDYVDAHSAVMREALWNWWLSVAQTRLEPPYLVVVLMTRWHEDDFVGRLLSGEHEGSPDQWEVVSLPAIAERNDAIGRAPGEPLISPLLDETPEQAVARWENTKRTIGSYVWSSMYLQSPAPSKGAIFDSGWWRFWTTDPNKATQDGRVVHLDPSTLTGGRWLDSWDCAFKGTDSSDFVVGQRWVRNGADRFLIAQSRGRMSFTQTLDAMSRWASPVDSAASPYGHLVHQRLVEEAANGAALIDTMRDTVSGIKPVKPKLGKEARARNITPEVESGHVYLPHPSDPGNEWVQDLLAELRDFPVAAHDDMVDALTQALAELRDAGIGGITVPGARTDAIRVNRDIAGAARSSLITRSQRGPDPRRSGPFGR